MSTLHLKIFSKNKMINALFFGIFGINFTTKARKHKKDFSAFSVSVVN